MREQVICVWVNHPNDQKRNRVYSTYVYTLYINEDPFQNQPPCWVRN
jgi:hypothetical protein